MHDYVQGSVKRRWAKGTQPADFRETKWVFRAAGKHRKTNTRSLSCLGVLVCSNPDCAIPVRPNTDKSARTGQLDGNCTVCGVEGLVHLTCDATMKWNDNLVDDDGNEWVIFEHNGTHKHPRPPASGLTLAEKTVFDQQVQRNPDGTALEHRTGSLPGSRPAAEISDHLADPAVMRYELAQSQARQGIAAVVSQKGELSLLKRIRALNEQLGEMWLVDSGIYPEGFFVFQSDFMKRVLESTVQKWATDLEESPAAGRLGLVTDGNNSSFKDGVLVTTCAFYNRLKAWVPVLFTLILGENEAHYRTHFRNLFKVIIEKVKRDHLRFKAEFFLNVMDFSTAQRNAHAEEYAQAVFKTLPAHEAMSSEAKAVQMDALREEAKKAEIGCEFHFWQQATRVKQDSGLVDVIRADDFERILRKMVSKKTTSNEFDEAVSKVHTDFPDAFNWLTWWIRPSHMGMIFPAKSTVDPQTASNTPSTSNAVEHSHSLLNQACGTGNELVVGAEKVFKFARKFENEDKAVTSGHYTPSGPRENRAPKSVRFFDNDGRGPDTAQAVLGLQPDALGARFHKLPLFTTAYTWRSPNSCFVDNGLEIQFRLYCLWTEETRARCRSLLSTECFLYKQLEHFDRRLKLIVSSKSKNAQATALLKQDLASHRDLLMEKLFSKWKPELDRQSYQPSTIWLESALQDGGTPPEAQAFFALHRTIHFACPSRHRHSSAASQPIPAIYINFGYLEKLLEYVKRTSIGLGDYLAFLPLFERNTTELHSAFTSPPKCCTPECPHSSAAHNVDFEWPQMLTVVSNLQAQSKVTNELEFSSTFEVKDQAGASVIYMLGGRVLHRKDHFTSELRIGDTTYLYNDMAGKLRKANSGSNPLEKRSVEESYFVYHRVSNNSKTSQTAKEVSARFKELMRGGVTGDSKHPLEITSSDSEEETLADALSRKKVSGRNTYPMHPTQKPSTSAVRPPDMLPPKKEDWRLSPPKQDTPSLIPEEIPSCKTCGIGRAAAKEVVYCDLCRLEWHAVCVRHLLPEDITPSFRFCCPQCIYPIRGRWDQEMLGTFVALDVNEVLGRAGKTPVFYPAKVMSRLKEYVTLMWYTHISWPAKMPHVPISISKTAQECYTARYRDIMAEGCDEDSFGSIHWPLALWDVTNERDREALQIQSNAIHYALKDAVPAVVEVLQGTRAHPIRTYMQYSKARWQRLRGKEKAMDQGFFVAHFRSSFSLPLYAGHRALAEYEAERLADHPELLGSIAEENTACASILFELVVLRVYLNVDASYDAEVYEASRILDDEEYEQLLELDEDVAKRARIVRHPSEHERVFNSIATNLRLSSEQDPNASELEKKALSRVGDLITSFQYKRIVDSYGIYTHLEDPSMHTRILQENGSHYEFGTFQHTYSDYMTLSGSLKPSGRPPSPPHTSPRLFPLLPPGGVKDAQDPSSADGNGTQAQPSTFRIIKQKSPSPKSSPKRKGSAASTKKRKLRSIQSTLAFERRQTRSVSKSVAELHDDGMSSPPSKKSRTH
ncbi:hypothetical protein NMY22_g9558 [Coprinellus aureogranulatus]|nr:hypothetical protein NMY22_g9558 [Coprinellus aureogranulatus]